MRNLSLKQKIIFGIILSIIVVAIAIYGYITLDSEQEDIDKTNYTNNELIENGNKQIRK